MVYTKEQGGSRRQEMEVTHIYIYVVICIYACAFPRAQTCVSLSPTRDSEHESYLQRMRRTGDVVGRGATCRQPTARPQTRVGTNKGVVYCVYLYARPKP